MRAAWYERQGPAAEVLQVGEMPDLDPAPGEVRVRTSFSGVNPGDTKKRGLGFGSVMGYPRIIPHSDGAGVIDRVGEGVDPDRVGSRVWVFGAQSYRPFGTAATQVLVPSWQASDLPEAVDDEVGACLGIPGVTAHRCVFADGAVKDRVVLVHGVRGGVGSLAGALATWSGARVIGTVRRASEVADVSSTVAAHVVSLDAADAADRIREAAPDGVDRVVEVALAANADLDAAVIAEDGVIAAYASNDPRPAIPFWSLLFKNVTVRLFGSDDFTDQAKRAAAAELTALAASTELPIRIAEPRSLHEIAAAHDEVDSGAPHGRVLISTAD